MVTVAAERINMPTNGRKAEGNSEEAEISVNRGFPDGIVFFNILVGKRNINLAIQPEDWDDIVKETNRANGS